MKPTFIFLLAVCMAGCVPHKDLLYVHSSGTESVKFENEAADLPIKANDELFVQVNSFDAANLNFMQSDASRSGVARSAADLALVSYVVNKHGQIDLPLLGAITVKDLTLSEAATHIQKELTGYLNTPTVKVSFVNKNITVLGNVKVPGRYYYVSDHINILQALGMAGDIEPYGNRKSVVVVREANGQIEKFRLNLTRQELLADKQFFLQSNDVVYVEPLHRQQWGVQTFPWALILSGVTTFILVLNYVDK